MYLDSDLLFCFYLLTTRTMEKLIKLLNEYKEEKNIFNTDMDWQLEIWKYRYVNYPCAERLCSKKFWFIERLVKNDKIDFKSENYLLKSYDWYYDDDILCIVNQDCNSYEDRIKVEFDKIDSLIMILSIQDNPIEYLCSILR